MLISTPITSSNHWRRRYPRPEAVQSIGLEAIAMLRDDKKAQRRLQKARAAQRDQQRTTGFAGGNPELGHRVTFEMRRLGYSETVSVFAGHLCAIAGTWNFQGNYRLAKIMGRHLRTVQRCRALLESEGLLRSYLIEPGDMVDGQRAPVTRPQVVRDVSALQRLANVHSAERRQPHQRSKNQSSAPASAPKEHTPISGEQLEHVARSAPDWLSPIIADAAAAKRAAEAGGSRSAADAAVAMVPHLTSHRGRMSAAELDQHLERTSKRRPITEQPTPAPLSADELDELDAELQRATDAQRRPPDKPAPH